MKIQFSRSELRYLKLRGMFDSTENAKSWNRSGASIEVFTRTARKINEKCSGPEEVVRIARYLPWDFKSNS